MKTSIYIIVALLCLSLVSADNIAGYQNNAVRHYKAIYDGTNWYCSLDGVPFPSSGNTGTGNPPMIQEVLALQTARGIIYVDNINIGYGFIGSGSGTVEDPYEITNCEELQNMNADLTATYVLMNDIDCSETINWPSVMYYGGYYTNNGFAPISIFVGTFDGRNHTISNLVINASGPFAALFGHTDTTTVIKNLRFDNAYVSGDYEVGLVAGESNYALIQNVHATNSQVIATGSLVGGLVGGQFGYLEDSSFAGTVTGVNEVGGLAGEMGEAGVYIINSHSTASVTGTDYIGGLVGKEYDAAGYIDNSYATGAVNGNSHLGGLVGQLVGMINNSYATGDVMGSSYRKGGLVGLSSGVIDRSFATGDVGGSGGKRNGGLVGESSGTISNSYATGAEQIPAEYSGGLVGANVASTITNCYSTGLMGGYPGNSGGLLGGESPTGVVTDSFWDVETSAFANSMGGTGKTTAEMQTQSTFTNWDFDSIWIMDGYPQLRWAYVAPPTPTSPAQTEKRAHGFAISVPSGRASSANEGNQKIAFIVLAVVAGYFIINSGALGSTVRARRKRR